MLRVTGDHRYWRDWCCRKNALWDGFRRVTICPESNGSSHADDQAQADRKSLPHAYEVKAEISNATLAKAKSALTLQIYRKDLKLGELQIGRGSLFWAGARRQSAKRMIRGRFAR